MSKHLEPHFIQTVTTGVIRGIEDSGFHEAKIKRGHGGEEVVSSACLQDLVTDSYIWVCEAGNLQIFEQRKDSVQTSLEKFLTLHLLKNGFTFAKNKKVNLLHTGHQHFFFSLLCFKGCNAVNMGGKTTWYSNQGWNVFEIVKNSKGKKDQNMASLFSYSRL